MNGVSNSLSKAKVDWMVVVVKLTLCIVEPIYQRQTDGIVAMLSVVIFVTMQGSQKRFADRFQSFYLHLPQSFQNFHKPNKTRNR